MREFLNVPRKRTSDDNALSPTVRRHTIFARDLRASQTEAEARLWARLRARRFVGLRFQRQQALGRYVVDFVCSTQRLIIEVDGSQHGDENAVQYDRARAAWLESQGYRVLRFWDNDVLKDTDAVLEAISVTLAPAGR